MSTPSEPGPRAGPQPAHARITAIVEGALEEASREESFDDGQDGSQGDAPSENRESSRAPEAAAASETDGSPPPPGGDGPEFPDERAGAVERMNREWAFVLIGSRAVVIREMREGPIEDRTRVVGLDAFKALFQNQTARYTGFVVDDKGERAPFVRYAKLAPLWLSSRNRRTCMGVEFFPDPADAPGTKGYFNLWRGYAVAPSTEPPDQRARRYATFRDHILTNVCCGDPALFRWVWSWFAHMVQRPRERIGTALVLRGKMGVGKTVAGEVIGSLFPSHYFLVDDPRYLTGQFNAHMSSCILLQVDEGFWAGDKAAEGRLKGLVTGTAQMIEAKGIDPIRLANYVRLIFSSNEGWVVPAGMDERRFAVLDVSDLCKENHGYFRQIFEEMENGGRAALLADLLALDLDASDAPNLRVIPKTGALLDQKIQSLDHVAAWWFERLTAGAQTRRGHEWRDAVPIETLVDDYVKSAERVGVRRRSESTVLGMKMRQLIPGLRQTRRAEWVDDGSGTGATVSRRVNCYLFPRLEACRAAFEAAVGQSVDWGRYGGVAGESEGDDEGADMASEGERSDDF